jgi:cytochrome c oxidase assembly protein subunit 15
MAAAALALVVIVFGAFVRLSNAGLSCPDWPTCYGEITWPGHEREIADANAAFPDRPVESHKTWREQFHRHLAATLGALVLLLALWRNWRWRAQSLAILAAVGMVGLAIGCYVQGATQAAGLLALAGEAVLVGLALRRCEDRAAHLAIFTLAVVIFQALLGMWTVTWKLKPIVVMGHLLGGLATFALLLWLALRSGANAARMLPGRAIVVVGVVLLSIQIALGGWTSANYAAMACGMEFPTCLGTWWPPTDFTEAFVLWRGIGVDYEGGVLDGPARAAIQLTHRVFALLVAGHLLALAWRLWRSEAWRAWGVALALALAAQVALGIANVVTGLPLRVAVLHNAGAAVLLAILVALLAMTSPAGAPARARP